MPSAEVNSVIIRPQPPRLRMKRRKTVSVMPAIGASTVAGRISTPPSETDAGTRAAAGAVRSAGLSKNLLIELPGFKSALRCLDAPSQVTWSQYYEASRDQLETALEQSKSRLQEALCPDL